MRAAAHTKGGYGGVPQSVGREFVNADKRKKTIAGKHKKSRVTQTPIPGSDLTS